MHEDRAFPGAEVRAGTRWGWEMLGPLQRRFFSPGMLQGHGHSSSWPPALILGSLETHLTLALTYTLHLSASEQTFGTFNMEGTSSPNLQMRKLRPREADVAQTGSSLGLLIPKLSFPLPAGYCGFLGDVHMSKLSAYM